MYFWVKNEGILYVGEGVTYFKRMFDSPSESGNPPCYGLSVSHSTETGHRAGKVCEQICEQTMNEKTKNNC